MSAMEETSGRRPLGIPFAGSRRILCDIPGPAFLPEFGLHIDMPAQFRLSSSIFVAWP